MTRAALIATILLILLWSVAPAHPAYASADQQQSAPFGLLLAVLIDARDRGLLQDDINDLLSDFVIEYLIGPATGETYDQVRQRLAPDEWTTSDFLAAVLIDAYERGSLPDYASRLLSDLLIENLILPATGETSRQVAQRLDADFFVDEGFRHSRDGDLKLSIESFTVAIYLRPDIPISYRHRARLLLHIGERDRAIEDYTEAIRLAPDDAGLYADRAEALRQRGYYHRALEDIDRAIELRPDDARFYRDRASLHFLLDDYDQAVRDYAEAIRLEPGNARLYADRARVYLETGDHLLAVADFDSAIALDPDDEWLRQNRPPSTPFPPSAPVRGVEGDLWADIILGKPDFSEIATNRVVPFRVFNPGGILIDRSSGPDRAYIWDSSNSRVLGLGLAGCYEGETPCSAQLVIGQPSIYDHSACNGDSGVQHYPVLPKPDAGALCGAASVAISPGESPTFVTMAVNDAGDLFVPDSLNNRILKYRSPFMDDPVADAVWGQSDFTGRLCNEGRPAPGPGTLCFHSWSNRGVLNNYGSGAEVDPEGNLWVADGGNNRVLRFPYDAGGGRISALPDLALGQPGFYSMDPGNSLDRLHAPSAVRLDATGRVYVADSYNDRVLVFDPPFRSGMAASSTFGSRFREPTSLAVDPHGRGIWVNDSGNHMIELWNHEGSQVLRVLGKESYEPDGNCGETRRTSSEEGGGICESAGGIAIDSLGNVLVPSYLDISDIFRYPSHTLTSNAPVPARPDMRLFYPPGGFNFTSPANIHSSRGVAVWKDQLIVSDIRRLMFWNGLDGLTSGQAPDGVVGSKFYDGDWPHCCGRMKTDEAGRLWVLSLEGEYFIDIYQLPLTEYSVPIHTIWAGDRTFPVLGTGAKTSIARRVFGILPTGGGEFLWLSDTDNHRVLRIRDPLTEPAVDLILGQGDHAGFACNRALPGPRPDTMCFPGALSVDNFGNLYVSDHALEISGNHRLLLFDAETVPAGNSTAVYEPAADKIFATSTEGVSNLRAGYSEDALRVPYVNETLPAATWEPAFDSSNRMVVGYNGYPAGRFVGVYDDPLGVGTLPDAYLYDFGSMPYTAAFDDDNNLYVGDINRGRVLVYRNPFGSPPRQETATTTPTLPPTPRYTATIHSVSPKPPQCVIHSSSESSETMLRLEIEGMSEIQDMDFLQFDFRRVAGSIDMAASNTGRVDAMGISIDMSRLSNPWMDYGKTVLTVQIAGHNGVPLSNWSPAFLLAGDKESCESDSPLSGP